MKRIQFPYQTYGKEKRNFQIQWLQKYKWIEYSIERDAAFCHICRHYGTGQHFKDQQTAFTIIGFRHWKKANSEKKGFAKHSASAAHIEAVQRKIEKEKRDQSGKSITELLSSSVLEKRRYYVKAIVETIIVLASNRLALRGDWDSEEAEESGLFNAIFEIMLAKDTHLVACEKHMPANARYKSPLIQNEIIDILAEMVRNDIVHEVLNADVDFFTILFDGTKDKNGDECISLAARYVSRGIPIETLLFFETTADLDAGAFTKLIIDSMEEYKLDANRIISQCYDGAAVMNGYKSGVSKRLQDYLKKIVPYVHCFNHRLHLVIVYTVSGVDAVRRYFEILKLIYTLFKKPKIRKIYEGKSVVRLLDTRWTGHLKASKAILGSYNSIVATIKRAIDDKKLKIESEDVATCIGLLKIITKEEFVLILLFMTELLSAIGPADIALQKRELSYRRAIPVIDAVKTTIEGYRNGEEFDMYWEKAEGLIADNATPSATIRPTRMRSRSSRLSGFTVEETIGERSEDKNEIKSIYFQIIDVALSELEKRFSENNQILLALSSSHEMDLAQLAPLEKLGIKLPPEHEMKTCKTFIAAKKLEWEKDMAEKKEEERTRFNMLSILYEYREMLPSVYNLYAAIDTFACSTAICEASFSSLSRVNIPSRLSMSNKRMRNLAFLAFESKRLKKISLDLFLKKFNEKKTRKVQLF